MLIVHISYEVKICCCSKLSAASAGNLEMILRFRFVIISKFVLDWCDSFNHIVNRHFIDILQIAWLPAKQPMMTSSNGNIFRVTGHLCGEFTGPRWIPRTDKGQWRRALMFSLICVWINDWVNNREAGDLRRFCAHYDVIVMHKENMVKSTGTEP